MHYAAAYAKTNLYLEIVNRRPDGYHNIRTFFQNISLCDKLFFEPADEFSLQIENSSNLPPLSVTDDNLVLKAARALKSRCPEISGAAFRLQKRIPFGAGLGGGSTDAAATLMALKKITDIDIPNSTLMEAAIEVGMDVPFFLSGAAAKAEGRGEILTPVKHDFFPWIVIVYPGFPISTALAYKAWNMQKSMIQRSSSIEDICRSLEENDYELLCKSIHNDFEILLENDYPKIAEIKNRMRDEGLDAAWLSGSGSSIIGITKDKVTSEKATAKLREKYGWAETAQFNIYGIQIF